MRKSATQRNKTMYCVIMGDIINSRELNDDTRKKATHAAQAAFNRINTKYIGSLMADFGMVRGDAFEGVMLTQSYAPQIVQDIIKAFYSVDNTTVRISVVLGELSVTDGNRNKTDGPAFHLALDRLAEIKAKKSPHWLQVHFDIGNLAQSLVDGQMALLTALTEGWTDKQRETVWAMENQNNFQKAVARKMGTTASVVNKQLKAANYEAYRMAWDGLTEYLAKMDEYIVEGKPVIDKSHVPYFNVAQRMVERHDFDGALKPAEKALDMAKQNTDTNDEQYIALYNLLAEIYTRVEQYEKAEKIIVESLRIQEPMPKARLQYAHTLNEKARLCWVIGSYEDAKKYSKEALEIARNVVEDDHPYVGELYNILAISHSYSNEHEAARDFHYKALSFFNEENDPVNYAVELNNIANSDYYMKNYLEAVKNKKKALKLFEENLPVKHEYIKIAQSEISHISSHQEVFA
ncbi:MAG: SatD family protein [Defluviitaleaceae bacterium]|nr:SatD family protein [Defluviitaleaceae bacterium]